MKGIFSLTKNTSQVQLCEYSKTSIMKAIMFLTTLFIHSSIAVNVFGRTLRPVIFVPGLEGSRLHSRRTLPNSNCSLVNEDFTPLWLDPIKPLSRDCFLDTLSLHYNRETRTTHNTFGVDISVPFFGGTRGVRTLSDVVLSPTGIYALPLVFYFFLRGGYVGGGNFRSAPYDWRKAPNELGQFFDQLKYLIEETYENQRQERVVLISHSFGGIQAWFFLHQQTPEWKQKYIHKFIPVSAPFGGTVEALSAYLTGLVTPGVLLSPSKKGFLETLPSIGSLLPNKLAFPVNQVLVQQGSDAFTVDDFIPLFNQLPFSDVKYLFEDTKDLLGNLEHPGVDITCVFSSGHRTKEAAFYDSEEDFPFNPRWSYGDGDGTVNLNSLETCLRWSSNSSFTFSSKVFENMNHIGTLQDLRVVSFLLTECQN